MYKPPFPWFGGKTKIAPLVWDVFGDVDNYIEPFFGAGHVLFNRPDWHRKSCETINDADMYVANFWRAVKHDPQTVAKYADNPVNEADLVARHIWLVQNAPERLARLQGDPDYFDPKVAGWWVWGICAWIGGGFCSGKGPYTARNGKLVEIKGNHNDGVYKKRPDIAKRGVGVLRQTNHIKGVGYQQPVLGFENETDAVPQNAKLLHYFQWLSARLRFVRVCCGDWSKVVCSGAMWYGKSIGVFLDPPYSHELVVKECYNTTDPTLSQKVREWCVQHTNDNRLKIILCGLEGEHNELEQLGWTKIEWVAQGGYTHMGKNSDNDNRFKERIWLSPSCKESSLCQKELESKNCTTLF